MRPLLLRRARRVVVVIFFLSAISAPLREPILNSIQTAANLSCLRQKRQRERRSRLPCAERAKKAPRKAHVPGGQRTLKPFRERLDAITLACGRTPLQSALGGRKRLPRVGECIVADGWRPCQHQPLRGLTVPSRGAGPSTWIVGLRSERRCLPASALARRQSQWFEMRPRRLAPRAPRSIPSSWGGRIRQAPNSVKVDFSMGSFSGQRA
jgi:hypothetical protein